MCFCFSPISAVQERAHHERAYATLIASFLSVSSIMLLTQCNTAVLCTKSCTACVPLQRTAYLEHDPFVTTTDTEYVYRHEPPCTFTCSLRCVCVCVCDIPLMLSRTKKNILLWSMCFFRPIPSSFARAARRTHV